MSEKLKISKKEVEKAVSALLQTSKPDDKKLAILKEGDNVNLQFTFKKIPKLKDKVLKLSVPHSFRQDNTDVCLFVKDLDRSRKNREHGLTKEHFKDLLQSKGVKGISEVIPLKQLKLEYKPFEAKKNLSNMFDLFLADERIVRLLPPLLGKHFYGRKRIPVSVNLRAQDLRKEINKAVTSARCIISGQGSSSMVTIGNTEMSEDNIVENVLAAAEQISSNIPGGPANVRNFYIKTTDSVALPIFVSLESADNVDLPIPVFKKREDFIDDVTTVVHGKVKVSPYGDISIINKATLKRKRKKKIEGSIKIKEDISGSKKAKKDVSGSKKAKKDISGPKKAEKEISGLKKAKEDISSENKVDIDLKHDKKIKKKNLNKMEISGKVNATRLKKEKKTKLKQPKKKSMKKS